MNIYKNARLTLARRMELVKDILEGRLTLCAAAARQTSLSATVSRNGRMNRSAVNGSKVSARLMTRPPARERFDPNKLRRCKP